MSGARLLVVEDDRTTANVMQLKLKSFGYEVSKPATNSDEAIQEVESFKPELVLMDIKLGRGKDGIETAKIIRDRYQIPVVFVTSYSDKKTIERATDTMPLGYINKPLRDKDLKTTVALALEKLKLTAKQESAKNESALVRHDIEIFSAANGNIEDYNLGARQTLKSLELDNIEDLLPHNHRQIIDYSLRIGNSYLVAGRLMDRIFSWEYIPNNTNQTVRIVCEDLTNNRRLSHSGSNEEAFKQTLNYLSVGVLLVNHKLEPTFINQAAEQFINNDKSLMVDDGTIYLATEELNLELVKCVSSSSGGVISMKQHHKDSSTELLISPLSMETNNDNMTTPKAIIFIFHAHKDAQKFEELLKALYRFTNAEARLASALIRDPRLEQAANSIGIKINTARSHLKKIFQKTGTDRQSSLINHIVSGPAGLIIKTGKHQE